MSKIVLVTGSSSGFGRDTAVTLKEAGHTVYASMREVGGKNAEAAATLGALGINVVELDVTDDASVDAAVETVLREAGRIDVLINNAGIASAGVSEAFTPSQTQAIFETNVTGLFRVCRAVLPSMRSRKDGLIVNVGSILGRVTIPFFGIYGASKMAVEALSESLRYEVSQLGIDVVLVQPSAYPTNMYAAIQTPADVERADAYGETGKIPQTIFSTFMAMFQGENAPKPHDVATAVALLVNEEKGRRSFRTVVGAPFGADAVNADAAPVQQQLVESLGLGYLAKVVALAP